MDSQLENLVFLLRNTNSTIWGIWTSDNKRVQEYKGENVEEAVNYLNRVFPYLEKKRFEFRYRPMSSNEKGQYYQSFDLTEKRMTNPTMPTIPQTAGMDMQLFLFLQEIISKNLRLELKLEAMEKQMDKFDKDLQIIFEDLNDEDPKNDKSAIEKLGKIANSAPSFINSIKSAKELF